MKFPTLLRGTQIEFSNRDSFNESCNALDHADKCENDCFDLLTNCIAACEADEACGFKRITLAYF